MIELRKNLGVNIFSGNPAAYTHNNGWGRVSDRDRADYLNEYTFNGTTYGVIGVREHYQSFNSLIRIRNLSLAILATVLSVGCALAHPVVRQWFTGRQVVVLLQEANHVPPNLQPELPTGSHPPLRLSQELTQTLTPLLEGIANESEIDPGSPEVFNSWISACQLIHSDDDQALMQTWVSCLYYISEFALGLSDEKRGPFVQNLRSFYDFFKESTKRDCDMDKLLWIAFINVRQGWLRNAERHSVHERLGITLEQIIALESSGFTKLNRWEEPLRNIEVALGVPGFSADFCVISFGFLASKVSIWSPLLSEEEAIRQGSQKLEETQNLFRETGDPGWNEQAESMGQSFERAVGKLRSRGDDRGMEELFAAISLLFGVR